MGKRLKQCLTKGGGTMEATILIIKELAYLIDIQQIAWVEFDKNNVYIGCTEITYDLPMIVSAAAVHGSEASDSEVNVWAVRAEDFGWKPGDLPYIYTATACRGKATYAEIGGKLRISHHSAETEIISQ